MSRVALPLILLLVLAVHLVMAEPTEPFYNGDETRHVMTGIFVADAITEGGLWHPKEYAERYYAQYPALGLIVWPPGFYAIEGVTMLAFGRTFETARWLTVAYCLLMCVYCYRLVTLTHGVPTAVVATLVLAFCREVFFHSRNVMLEVPTLTFVLMAMLHLERFLQSARRRDLVLMALGCILAGLHRYDTVLLILVVAFRILFAGRWEVLKQRSVWLAGLVVVSVLAPVYGLAAWEIGGVQASAAGTGTDPTSIRGNRFEQSTYLLATLWAQLGHLPCIAAVVGLLLSFRKNNRAKSAPYWSLTLGTFLFFSPLAEQESRHAIFWLPAWCVWAADAALCLSRFRIPLALVVIGGAMFWTLKQPVPWVRGYGDAASYLLEAHEPGPAILFFDGHLSGTMIYELRTRDANRELWVLRSDKLLYAAKSDPSHGYIEHVADRDAMVKRLIEVAPDYIVIEEPRARTDTPMARRLRDYLKSDQTAFALVAAFEVHHNNLEWLDGVTIQIYKSRRNHSEGERRIRIPMLWQGGAIDAVIPPSTP